VTADLPPELVAKALRLRDDFEFFARNCLKIRTKTGEILPLTLNKGQRHLHERLQRQLRKTGRVRALIVKGRQMGISTYLQARFYWLLWRAKKGMSLKAFILTHHDDATSNLFGMAQRFHDLMPGPLRPFTTAASAKELVFADTGCGYAVATAGTKELGRSDTIQLLHGSEVPSWPNAESHVVSLLTTALAKTEGSEGILEATAKGVGNVFHRMAMAAVRKQSEYEAIFIPWFWDEGYVRDCPSTFQPSEEWLEYAHLHKLTWEQLYWAYVTNRELAQAKALDPQKICGDFKQEYPATFEEAFQSSGNSFIPALHVMRARHPEEPVIGRGPVILGVDPSRVRDKVGIIDRCGRRLGERICERMDPGGNLMYVASQIARIIDRIKPDAVNIDVGGIGAGVYDALEEMGYGYCINAVNFGSRPLGRGPTGEDLYFNRRAEMYDLMRDWFASEAGVQIEDDDGLHADLTAAEWGPQATRYNTTNELILEPKEKIIERLGSSPDLGDAAALTFAVPFAQGMVAQNQPPRERRRSRRTGY
jgi:hypothetical protein